MTWSAEPGAGRFDRWLRELSRTLRWRRRLLAAAVLAGAMACALQALTPTAAPGSAVLVAARDLAPGSTLRPLDLRRVSRPHTTVPDGSLSEAAAAVGRVVGSAVRRGEVLTDVRLVGPSMLAGLGPGLVATPVRIADPQAAALLRPGDVIDVLAAGAPVGGGEPSSRLVASGARVLATPTAGSSSFTGDLGQGALLLLATTGATAARLAAAAVAERLSVVLRPG